MTDLTVVMLTKDEEVNIRHSVGNMIDWAKDVFVLDSGSIDKIVDIAKEMGAVGFVYCWGLQKKCDIMKSKSRKLNLNSIQPNASI